MAIFIFLAAKASAEAAASPLASGPPTSLQDGFNKYSPYQILMTAKLWYHEKDNHVEGPISLESLAEMFAQGHIREETLVWSEGMPTWKTIKECENIVQKNLSTKIQRLSDYVLLRDIVFDERVKNIIYSEVDTSNVKVFFNILNRQWTHIGYNSSMSKDSNWGKIISDPISLGQSLWSSLGVKTGKSSTLSLSYRYAIVQVAILCYLARQSYIIASVFDDPNQCLLEVTIPSSYSTFEGSMKLCVNSIGDKTDLHTMIEFRGQAIDWGRSNKILDNYSMYIKDLCLKISINHD